MSAPVFQEECPVVEWVEKADPTFEVGELFELVGVDSESFGGPLDDFISRVFRRVLDGRYWSLSPFEVRPLTNTAKEMLQMIKVNRGL